MHVEPPAHWPFAIAELRPAVDLIATLTRVHQAVLLLSDDGTGMVRPALGLGLDIEQWPLALRPDGQDDPLSRAIVERQRVTVHNSRPSASALPALATRLGARTVEVLPLLDGDGPVVGAMVLLSQRSRVVRPRVEPLIDEALQLLVRMMSHARRREAAERARADSEQSAQARAQFFARMSHELRTPLQSIAGYLDLLRLGVVEPLTAGQERLLARVQHNEELLVHVIDDLILFARLGTSRLPYHIGVVAADEAVHIAERSVTQLATSRGVRLTTETCRGLIALADGEKLRQILFNVAAHAVKSCQPRGHVEIGCRADEPWVVFEIRDDGPGYSADQLRVLFEPYAVAEEAPLDRGETGIGLAISHELAAGMHGQLTAANLPQGGAVLTLRLPRGALPRA